MIPILIFGKSGMLATSFQTVAQELQVPCTVVSSSELAELVKNKSLDPLISKHRKSFLFYCIGPTSPTAPIEEHEHFHLHLPLMIQNALTTLGERNRLVTFGSIHELVSEMCAENNYLKVKREWLKQRNAANLHFQLHTLVGVPLRAESFFYQLADSILNNKKFLMSQGDQIREFHDVNSISEVLLKNLCLKQIFPPENPMLLSNGESISLYEAAASVLAKFNGTELLSRGARPGPKFEVYEPFWPTCADPWRPRSLNLSNFVKDLIQQKRKLSGE